MLTIQMDLIFPFKVNKQVQVPHENIVMLKIKTPKVCSFGAQFLRPKFPNQNWKCIAEICIELK